MSPRQALRGALKVLMTLDGRLAPTIAAIRAEMDDIDGYGSGRSYDAVGSAGSSTSTPTERHAFKRMPHSAASKRLTTIVSDIGHLADEAIAICDRYSPPVEYPKLKCAAGPHEPWWKRSYGLECDNIVPTERRAKGLCDPCRMRKARADEA